MAPFIAEQGWAVVSMGDQPDMVEFVLCVRSLGEQLQSHVVQMAQTNTMNDYTVNSNGIKSRQLRGWRQAPRVCADGFSCAINSAGTNPACLPSAAELFPSRRDPQVCWGRGRKKLYGRLWNNVAQLS